MPIHRLLCCLLVAVACWYATPAAAQPVPSRDPDTTHLFPAGGRRGSTIPVHVGTECFPPGAKLKFYGTGLQGTEILEHEVQPGTSLYADEPSPRRLPEQLPISYPREWQAEFTIDADTPLGPHLWRATCAQGGSRARVFVVGDLPEFIETESNSQADRAERVQLPVTINGRISGERDLDYFVFQAKSGEVIHCEVCAGRLGSPLDPVVTIYDDRGQRISAQETQLGVDPMLTFVAPRDGDYRLLVANVSLHGGPDHVYRVTLTTAPRPVLAFPAGGEVATAVNVELMSPLGDGGWKFWKKQLQLPAERGLATFWEADDCAIRVEAGNFGARIESDETGKPNDLPEQAERISCPLTLDGRFATADDSDWFRFTASKGEQLSFVVEPAPLASRATPTLEILDADLKSLNQVSAYETPGRDCRLEWKCPTDGEYLVCLRDTRHGIRGGRDYIYRFTAAPAELDFALSLPQEQLNILPDGKVTLTLNITRTGGFAEAISLECEGLPEGVSFQPQEVSAKQTSVKLTFTAAADSRPADVSVQLVGVAQVNGESVRHAARAPLAAQDSTGASLGEATTDELFLTVRHKPVFRLYCGEAYLYAHRGMIFPYSMQVERLDDYDGEVILQSGDRQNRDLDGVGLLRHVVPGDSQDTHMPILLPESMHANVQSQSQLYVQGYTRFVDSWGDPQSLLVVSEKRCMLRTLPTVVKLKSATESLTATPGEKVRVPLVLKRTSNFNGPMRLELVSPPAGLEVPPLEIGEGQEEIAVPVSLPADLSAESPLQLHFRATGDFPGHLELISETDVEITLR